MKKYLLLGFGITGKAVYEYLTNKGYVVDIISDNEKECTIDINNIDFGKYEYIIRSPGVNVFSKAYNLVIYKGVPIISEIELANQFIDKKVLLIGITGSNGKTTTVELLYNVLKRKYVVYKAGNIGIPFISIIDKLNDDDVVILELSSFQLENIQSLHFNIGVITSLCPNHLDSVFDLDYYYNSKLNIVTNMQEKDVFLTFMGQKEINKVVINSIKMPIDLSEYKIRLCKKRLLLKGKHNYDNVKIVFYIASLMGIDRKTIKEVLYEFHPLEHRMEYVGKYNNYTFINDSKSTSILATLKALSVYKKNTILIIGGKDKQLDYSIFDKYKNVYVYGEIKEKVKCKRKYNDLEEVMIDIFTSMKGKKTVLFSPSTSSYDQYTNYEERGKHFKKLYRELSNES